MVGAVALSFESELTRGCKLFTCFTILLIRDNPHKHFIFHEVPILSLLESNKELESAELGAPGVAAAGALELEVAALLALEHEKLFAVPLLFVFDGKYFCERLLAGPLHLNPLNRRAVRRHRNILMAVYVVLDLLDIRFGWLSLLALVIERRLEPIGDLENIPRL